MEAELYLQLREELQADAVGVERRLEELRRAESFLLRRIHSTAHVLSYQSVLSDLEGEITGVETELAELLHLERYVTRSLIDAYGKQPPRTEPPLRPDQAEPALPRTRRSDLDAHAPPVSGPSNGKAKNRNHTAKIADRMKPPADSPP